MKVLYIYSGNRREKFPGDIGKDFPDTQFYGLNYLNKFGIDAEHKDFDEFVKNKLLKKIIGFRLKHFLLYFFTRKYDLVFGSSLLYMLFLKKIFKTKTKFVILSISLIRTIVANKKNFLKSKIINWLLKEVDAVVCLSNIQKKNLEDSYGFLCGKVFFVPLGVDVNYYKPVYFDRKNYILSVGRDNGRDYKTIIDVALLLPDTEFHIVCSRRNLFGIKNIPVNVKVFYDITFSDLTLKYKEAKILLLITHSDKHLDGSDCSGQTVLLDAMASGLPVIASKKVYLQDYVIDKEDVLLTDCYSVRNILESISYLQDDQVRQKIAKSARGRIDTRFSTEKMAEGLSKVFKTAITYS